MANVIEEINAIQEELNKNPEYRKRQLETQYILLKDRVLHLLEETKAIQIEIDKLMKKAEAEGGMKDFEDDLYVLGAMLRND